MKTVLLFYFLAVAALPAQTILLKDGQSIPATGMERKDDLLMTQIKTSTGGVGQVGTPISNIASLELPEPAVLATAADLIGKNRAQEALTQIEPELALQTSIRDLPGNWWAKTALVEVSALLELNRADDATKLLQEISGYSKDPEILQAAKLRLVLLSNDPDVSLAACESIIQDSHDSNTLAEAWLNKGQIQFTHKIYNEALMDFLTIPVFYPDQKALLPKALWGIGQAYHRLQDPANAHLTLEKLVKDYPDTPEAGLAQKELAKESTP